MKKNSKLVSKLKKLAATAASAATTQFERPAPVFWFVEHLNTHTNEILAASSANEYISRKLCADGKHPLWSCPQSTVEQLARSGKLSSDISYRTYYKVGHDGIVQPYSGDIWKLIASSKTKPREDARRHPFSAQSLAGMPPAPSSMTSWARFVLSGSDRHRGPSPQGA